MREAQRQREAEAQEAEDARLIVIIAGALAVGASAAATASKLASALKIPVAILKPILVLAMAKPMSFGIPTTASPGALVESSALEPTFRAHYVLSASRRVYAASAGTATVQEALAAERTFFNQHLEAVKRRLEAAKQVDAQASQHGDELGWYAKMDSRTSAECREADGKNFFASQRPAIGYPGSVHPHCRCKAGRKHNTMKTVYSVKAAA